MKYCLRTRYPWVLQVYNDDGANFPQQNSLALQKIVADVDKVVNFKDSSWPNKKSSTFQGP